MDINDIKYRYNDWINCIEKVQIIATEEKNNLCKVNYLCVVDGEGNEVIKTHGFSWVQKKFLFDTYSDAYDDYTRRYNKQVNAYCSEIKTLKDLLEFPLTHCFCGEEYTDYEAVAAYKAMAKELIDVTFD